MKNKFNDSPFLTPDVTSVADFDKIEVNNFAESIAEFIVKCDTPMTIGLQGDWGTGKTSMMNMIKVHLTKLEKERFHKIDVNTWHYSIFRQDEYLGIVIIQSLLDELSKRFEKQNKEVSGSLKRLGENIGKGLQKAISIGKAIEIGIPGGGVTINDIQEAIKGKDTSLQVENLSAIMLQFKNEFTELIEKNVKSKNERIIFFVDDLDRIRPIKAIEVLETLKNFMDVDGCVFVLAVDYEIVQLGIAEKFGRDIQKTSGKSFFDKIIQLPFTMPTSSYNIEKYLSDLLIESGFYNFKVENNQADISFFVNITEVTVGRNPRSIKRAVNYLSLLDIIRTKSAKKEFRKDREATRLLYAIVCMQIAWPELFDYFVLKPTPDTLKNLENWDFLDKLPQAKRLFARVNDSDEVKDNISAYFDSLYSILDTSEKDGIITEKELKPLISMLQLVKLTSETAIKNSVNPIEEFKTSLKANAAGNKSIVRFYENIYSNSFWTTNDEIEYKRAGVRYYTIIFKRKQLGSLVTLKGRPLVIRIKESKADILKRLTDLDSDLMNKIVKDLDKPDSLTGIGYTEIDYRELMNLSESEAIDLLNRLFQAIALKK